MSINNKRSYVEYTVTEPTTDFVITFEDYDVQSQDRITVSIDGVLAESQGYAVMRKNEQVVTITPAVTSGTVRLERETNIDEPFHKFTAGALFSAKSMDENFAQIRHSQQEVRDGFEYLEFNTNGVVQDAKAATDRANAAAELAENTDVAQLQLELDNQQVALAAQKLDTGITATAKFGGIERTQAEKNTDFVSVKDFGAIGDGQFHPLSEKYSTLADAQAQYPSASSLNDGIDSLAIQAAIDAVARAGDTSTVYMDGYPVQDRTIVLKSNVHLSGSGFNTCVITKKEGFNGRALITEGFDSLTGTVATSMPRGFSIKGVKFDGRYLDKDWNSTTNSYVNTSGGGLFIYGQEYDLDVYAYNMAGVGVWLEAKSANSNGLSIKYDLRLKIKSRVCKEECFIFKGGADIILDELFCAMGGTTHKQDVASRPLASPTYGNVNGGTTDNVVFDVGCEIGKVHTFGASSGYGMRVNSGRINADLLISETVTYGAFFFGANAYGIISKLDAHSCYGGKDASIASPDIVIESSTGQGLHIGSARNDRTGHWDTMGQTSLSITGSNNTINSYYHNNRGKAGHGVYIKGAFNTLDSVTLINAKGVAADGEKSTALTRDGNFSNKIKMQCIGYETVFNSLSEPFSEYIEIMYRNGSEYDRQDVHRGQIKNYSRGQNWVIHGEAGNKFYKTWSVTEIPYATDTAEVQMITVPHNLICYSNINNFQVTQASAYSVPLDFVRVQSVNADTATIALKVTTPTTTTNTPTVTLHAKN